MTYVALYRKYRSQSFDELMGQEQVTVTLQNAIRSGRIAHAYLFYGARGCGKTSTARLLARALNCVAQDGPTPEPCGVCRLCVAIRDGSCMDVLEMDAASETGIDDVREKIIETVQYAPGEARYKVYIIDEVHDLSAKAFDALLKTLEEPPAHVIFVLATTEHHKVPITIRSRCQEYHFKRGALQDLARSVQRVIDMEGCTAEPEAVHAIARAAEGSWRDALSLLEQVLAYADGHVTAEIVHRAIGSVGTETLARVTETLAKGDWCETLSIAGELIDSGKDVRQLLSALSAHLRDLLLISAGARTAAQQELGPEKYARLQAQGSLFDPPTLLTMAGLLAVAEREIRFTNQHRWLLESTLLRLMPCNLAPAAAPPARAAAAPQPYVPPRRETVASTPTVVPRPHPVAPVIDANESSVSDDVPPSMAVEQSSTGNGTSATVPAAPVPSSTMAGNTTAQPADASNVESRFADDISLAVIQRAWPHIMKLFKKASPSGYPFLEKGEVVELDGHVIVLGFTDTFARDRIQNHPKGKVKVEQVINQGLNTDGFKIRCTTLDPGRRNGGSPTVIVPPAPAPPTSMEALLEATLDTEPTSGPLELNQDNGGSDQDTHQLAGEQYIPATGAPGIPPTGQAAVKEAGPAQPPSQNEPSGPSLVAEALSVFGGTVVRTEPR
jgi:DNA polymerase-3 subunit gamma/tau